MRISRFTLFILFFTPLLFVHRLTASEKFGEHLSKVLPTIDPTREVLVWVYFVDKGNQEGLKASVPLSVVSEASIRRRLKVRASDNVVDYTDLPIEQDYVNQIIPHVISVRQRSKWFNSVSVRAFKTELDEIAVLPFVREIELVARSRRDTIESRIVAVPYTPPVPQRSNGLDYGLSRRQLEIIGVPTVHESGNFGQGVIVGVFDNGVRLLEHEVFDSLHIIATYDFVDHKVSVKPNNPGTNFGFHGVLTLSNIAGYKPGQVIGPAPRASYILARTENDSSETPIEEDNWVAAIEWADSLGVQVTSTSLGYLTYDPPYTSWTWEDMNGHTTVITRAADLAVSKGIVVVNSAGNNGFNSLHNTLNAPADGDSVLTVGAVDSSGVRTGFSSVGPTTSSPPHIKPDVMGQGSLVYCASYTDPTGYIYSGGTSHSCPLVAGVAALMLSANPNLTPMQVVDALRSTASRSTHPDNEYGWGIVNAPAAINMNPSLLPTSYGLKQNFPNPFNAGTTITYDLPNSSSVTLKIFDVLGREVRTLVNDIQSAGNRRLLWDARDSRGAAVASGVYFYRLTATSVSQSFSETKKLVVVR